jgi:hypothetical protein
MTAALGMNDLAIYKINGPAIPLVFNRNTPGVTIMALYLYDISKRKPGYLTLKS